VSAQTSLAVLSLSIKAGNNAPSWRAASVAAQLRADSGGSRPGFRDDLAHHSDLMSLAVPR
jgi:hypothetical protein